MSAYDSVVVGKLKLKGKPLHVKAGGIKKKKKHDKSYHRLSESNSVLTIWMRMRLAFVGKLGPLQNFQGTLDGVMQTAKVPENRYSKGRETSKYGGNVLSTGDNEDSINETDNYGGKGGGASYDDHLTPAERRYLEQTLKLELQRLAKMARSSHRDRIQEFNQYLANLSEHYDIPKVGNG